jgi:hypothetical protein
MIIVPGHSPQTQSRRSRELAERIDRTVRDYRSDHPETTDHEVRSALLGLAPSGYDEISRQRRVVAIVIGVACAVGFGVMASTGGGRTLNANVVTIVVSGVAAAAGLVIAVVRLARRT